MSKSSPKTTVPSKVERSIMGYQNEEVTTATTSAQASGDREPRDTSVKKLASTFSPRGAMGQKYLASGKHVSMRLWEEFPPGNSHEHARSYETVGYVIAGEAELNLEHQRLRLMPGDSWVVPRGARHSYRILSEFKAVEATTPPADVHARDER